MSEGEQTNGEDQGQPDDSEPSLERQAKLEQAYEANVAAGDPPYKDVWIQTRGELRWVMEKRKWSSEIDIPKGYERANLTNANLSEANLSGASLRWAKLTSADLSAANLTNANLSEANLTGTDLRWANLSSASLRWANLSSADLRWANLSGADLMEANLTGASLSGSRMDVATSFTKAILDTSTRLADVIWNNTTLTRIAWEEVPRLGDEAVAHQRKAQDGKRKVGPTRLDEYQAAARSYRQLVVALRDQGLNEDADRYAYRAQLMQRIVLRRQAFLHRKDRRVGLGYRIRKFTAYIGSGLLDLVAGYGYRPGRSLLAYILIILTFAGLYLLNGQFAAPHLRWDEALVLSVSSFHGRGFFTTDIHLGDTLARLAAGEAIVGLLIEITFIATFTQRFFSR